VTGLLATFRTSHEALRAEQTLKGGGLAVELIPVPRQIRSDCGFCLLLEAPGAALEAERLERLRACGGQDVWRVTVIPSPTSSRKEKRYERIP